MKFLQKTSLASSIIIHAYFIRIVDDYNVNGNPTNIYNLNSFPSLFQVYFDKKFKTSSTVSQGGHHLPNWKPK